MGTVGLSVVPSFFCLSLAAMAVTVSSPCHGERSFIDAVSTGQFDLFLRYRFEHVDDGEPGIEDANANTLRTALGYNTGSFYDLGVYLQLEDVRALGRESFNDGGANGVTDHALVVDPEGTEVNQANLRYDGLPRTVLRVGRQEIAHREAPLHRFVGNVLWRQNWQSFDAFRILNLSIPYAALDYAYVWNVNTIFGEDNPLPGRSDFPMDSHLLRAEYTGLALGKLEAYTYLLDFDDRVSERFSTATGGLRLEGDQGLTPNATLTYAGEFARQYDYAENSNDIDVNYYLGEVGLSYNLGWQLQTVALNVGYEVLEGDGGVDAFQTPLGTNHAFQGWADRFLITPGDGVEDLYVTLKLSAFGAVLLAVYHDFNADREGYDYGREWDVVLERPLGRGFLVGVKYAHYEADRNAINVIRNSTDGQAFDLSKTWAYLQFRF